MKFFSGLVVVALATTTLVVAPPAQAAETSGDRAVAAGVVWLKGQLTDGILHNEEYDYDDLGLSADIAFALDAVGGEDTTVAQIGEAVSNDAVAWYDYFGTVYTGSAAKAVALMQVAGLDATDVGGVDLQAVVEGNVAMADPIVGRVQNANETDYLPPYAPTDSLNVISQSWAARGLAGQDSNVADEVMAFLLDQQCDDGSFRAALTTDKTAAEQGCAAGVAGDVDTTALAVINILYTPDAPVTAKGAAYLAASWLKTQQATDGSFSAGALGTNSNSTGLAGWALAEAGQDGAATKAAGWVRGLQVADLAPCAATLSADNGAIAYKPADLTAVRSAGSFSVPLRELARRASAQALPALAQVPVGNDVTISAPATALEQSTVTITVEGLGAGEPACVTFGGQSKKVTGTGSGVGVAFGLPAGAATHTFRVTTLTGSATANTSATAFPVTTAPPVSPVVGELVVARVEKVKNNAFKLTVSCDSTVTCAGKLKVRSARKVELANGEVRKLLIAKKEYSVAAGKTAAVRLTLQRPARKVLGAKRLRVVATQTARGAEPASTAFWLRRK